MAYVYSDRRSFVFTEEGVDSLTACRRFARAALEKSDAVMDGKLMSACAAGDSWDMLAVIDFMVERGELRRIDQIVKTCRQDVLYVAGETIL